MFAEEPTKVYF